MSLQTWIKYCRHGGGLNEDIGTQRLHVLSEVPEADSGVGSGAEGGRARNYQDEGSREVGGRSLGRKFSKMNLWHGKKDHFDDLVDAIQTITNWRWEILRDLGKFEFDPVIHESSEASPIQQPEPKERWAKGNTCWRKEEEENGK